MSVIMLNEFKSRISNCEKVEDYVSVLQWGVRELDNKQKVEGFKNPIIAMYIEVFMVCPDALNDEQKIKILPKNEIGSFWADSTTG